MSVILAIIIDRTEKDVQVTQKELTGCRTDTENSQQQQTNYTLTLHHQQLIKQCYCSPKSTFSQLHNDRRYHQ